MEGRIRLANRRRRQETLKKLPRAGEQSTTGIGGLDYLLRGGLPPHRIHLIEGHPGAGKTTFGLQFLLEGIKRGESCMYITLSETAEELRANAASHGWALEGIHIQELQPAENLRPEEDTRSSIRRKSSWAICRAACSKPSKDSGPPAQCSTRCPICDCWRGIRCDIGGRFWASSSSSWAAGARCCCSTKTAAAIPTRTFRASRTA